MEHKELIIKFKKSGRIESLIELWEKKYEDSTLEPDRYEQYENVMRMYYDKANEEQLKSLMFLLKLNNYECNLENDSFFFLKIKEKGLQSCKEKSCNCGDWENDVDDN